MSTIGENQDLISVITNDHQALRDVFAELESGTGTPEYRTDLAHHVIAELVIHAVSEERFLYPTARERLNSGEQVADKELEDHAQVEKLMKQLETFESTYPQFDRLLNQLIGDTRGHVEDEENNLLPALRAACPEQELRDLGEKVLRIKQVAPTKPHPRDPDQPPAHLTLESGTGVVDQVRDALIDTEG